MANYSYVVDNSFQPFSMQEMLVPFTAYKDAFEKSEEVYNDLSNRSDKFKYLSETLPEDSKARKLYEGYANELAKQAEDLAHNGLTMSNRSALTSMKRRYQGEIGRIVQADEAMREERKLRQTLNAQDSSRLYATDNLSIDDFLDGNSPNLYNISGNDLYAKGAAAGKAASLRMFSAGEGITTLGGYYRDFLQRNGYNADAMEAFYNDISTIPELQNAIEDILAASGASNNLSGTNLERAKKNVLRGIMDGVIYQESHNPVKDLGKITAAEQAQMDLQKQQFNMKKSMLDLEAAKIGYKINEQGTFVPDTERMKVLQKQNKKNTSINTNTGDSTSSETSGGTRTQSNQIIKISWHGNDPEENTTNAEDFTTKVLSDASDATGTPYKYSELPPSVRKQVDKQIGNGNAYDYDYMYQPFKEGFWNDTETEITMIPRKTGIKNNKNSDDTLFDIH